LGVTQKTAWFMLHRLRLALKTGTFGTKVGGPESSGIEVDETFVGGKVQNMHRARRIAFAAKGGHTGGYTGKAVVMGILDRDERKVRASVVPNTKRTTLQNAILDNVHHGSPVFTDTATVYDNLNEKYIHETVNHAEAYVKGRVHTNGLENFWSLLKRGLKGTYVAVEPFHLERYIDEQAFRYNNRGTKDNPLTDADRFLLALSQVAGKRLTFAELTGKSKEIPF
jgi:transposase-like protein